MRLRRGRVEQVSWGAEPPPAPKPPPRWKFTVEYDPIKHRWTGEFYEMLKPDPYSYDNGVKHRGSASGIDEESVLVNLRKQRDAILATEKARAERKEFFE